MVNKILNILIEISKIVLIARKVGKFERATIPSHLPYRGQSRMQEAKDIPDVALQCVAEKYLDCLSSVGTAVSEIFVSDWLVDAFEFAVTWREFGLQDS
jgi:hypothetical protein